MSAPLPAQELRDRTVGDIAATIPGATAILRRFGINFCCGGELTLQEAASRRGASVAELESALREVRGLASSDSPSPASMNDADLASYIVSHYHGAYRRMLPELIALSTKVEAVHRAKPNVPAGLADALQRMEAQLAEHMRYGEETLFPAIQKGDRTNTTKFVAQLQTDHDQQAAAMEQIEKLTGGFEPPVGACRSWQALYLGGARLAEDLMEHIYLENNVLFPRLVDSAQS